MHEDLNKQLIVDMATELKENQYRESEDKYSKMRMMANHKKIISMGWFMNWRLFDLLIDLRTDTQAFKLCRLTTRGFRYIFCGLEDFPWFGLSLIKSVKSQFLS